MFRKVLLVALFSAFLFGSDFWETGFVQGYSTYNIVNNQKEKCTQSVVESVCSNCNLITNTQTTNNNGNNNNNNSWRNNAGRGAGEEIVTGIAQKTNGDNPEAQANGNGESSPFMPKRPEDNKKK